VSPEAEIAIDHATDNELSDISRVNRVRRGCNRDVKLKLSDTFTQSVRLCLALIWILSPRLLHDARTDLDQVDAVTDSESVTDDKIIYNDYNATHTSTTLVNASSTMIVNAIEYN